MQPLMMIYAINFNPLRPCGRRRSRGAAGEIRRRFQSTPPVWAETEFTAARRTRRTDFNPLRPCGRRQKAPSRQSKLSLISIHSARVGGDFALYLITIPPINFNPLRPCGRRPTRSRWRANTALYFNPLRPCGRRLSPAEKKSYTQDISIHSARVGGDLPTGRLELSER